MKWINKTSFPRKRESSCFNKIWIPAFAGMTAFFLMTLVLLVPTSVFAQAGSPAGVSRPLVLLLALAALSLVPFVLMMATSFVKLAVVLSLIRNALGTQQVPPNVVVTGLALILTVYIMSPVGLQVYNIAKTTINQGTNQPLLSQASVEMLTKAVKEGKEPVRNFLLKHAHEKDKKLFYNLAVEMRKKDKLEADVHENDFLGLIPAFVISELTEAFQIGFIIFLPFLVIDIVVANILLSLGMFQISPVTLSLPFKLLLFVMVDGWHLIVKGIIQGYV